VYIYTYLWLTLFSACVSPSGGAPGDGGHHGRLSAGDAGAWGSECVDIHTAMHIHIELYMYRAPLTSGCTDVWVKWTYLSIFVGHHGRFSAGDAGALWSECRWYAYPHRVPPPSPKTAADMAHSTQPALRPHRATPRAECVDIHIAIHV